MRRRLFLLAWLLAPGLATPPARAQGWTPTPTPVSAARSSGAETSTLKLPFLGLLWFYRNAISPLDGPRCRMWPTCSAYATQAVRLHGPLLGSMLAADRLMHEGGAREPEYRPVEHYGRTYLEDPVSRNDWMFGGARATPTPTPAPQWEERSAGARSAPLPPPASADSARALADALARGGEPFLAVTEYRRAAYLRSDPGPASDDLLAGGWTAARAIPAAGQASASVLGPADEADRLFDEAEKRAASATDPTRVAAARYGRAFAHLTSGSDYEALRRFDELARGGGPTEAEWMRAWSGLAVDLDDEQPLPEMAKRFSPLRDDPDHGEAARGLLEELSHTRDRRKSPAMAMALNFVLPGAGWTYAGRPLIGLGSFLLNGAFITGAVFAARDGNWPLMVVLISLESGWYFGGAGGAALDVEERNLAWRRDFQKGLRRRFLGGVGPNGLAAALLF